MSIKRITLSALLAAVYLCLTLVLMNFGFGPIQIRVAEVLCLLCLYKRDFIIPITLGCALSNLIGVLMGMDIIGYLDVVFGTLATFISLELIYKFRNIKLFNKPLLSMMMPVLFNAIIIGAMLAEVMQSGDNFMELFMLNATYVACGEFIAVVILGLLLEKNIKQIASLIKFD